MTQTTALPDDERPTGPAMRKGWAGRCPNCGQGRLLHSYLKVNATCASCGEALHHQRADDGPAYLTILIVGHILAPTLLFVYSTWEPAPLPMALALSAGCISLSLYLLPRLKGALIGIQWAKRMHGFGTAPHDH